MKNVLKNKRSLSVLRQDGFVPIIIIIIIALLLMKYYGISLSTVLHWANDFVLWFTNFFKDILK